MTSNTNPIAEAVALLGDHGFKVSGTDLPGLFEVTGEAGRVGELTYNQILDFAGQVQSGDLK